MLSIYYQLWTFLSNAFKCNQSLEGNFIKMNKFILLFICLVGITFTGFAQKFGKYTLYSVQNSQTTQLVDTNGVTFKTWNHGMNARTGYSCYLQPGGVLVRSVSNMGNQLMGGGMTGRVQKVAWDGTVLWDFTYSSATYCLHHDICPLPNGNVLMISYDVHTAAEATQAGANQGLIVWADKIIEVKQTGPTTGEIVWQWRAWDHLVQNVNPAKDNYQTSIVQHPERLNINFNLQKDWIHMNGLDYNPVTDQIVFSSHNLNEWYVIDHSTSTTEAAGKTGGNSGKGGDILYRWGNPAAYGAAGTKILNVTHDAHWIPEGCPNEGRLVGYNNGGQTNPNRSTIDMIMPPKNGYNFNLTLGQAFTPATYAQRIVCNGSSTNMSNSQQLPNGNTLYTVALSGAIYEVNPAGTTIWTKNGLGGNCPQAFRYTECYVNGPVLATPAITANGSELSTGDAQTYQWYRNGEKIDGATSQTYVATDAGVYVVRVTYANSCEYYYSYSNGYKVTIQFPLNVQASAAVSTVCAGANVQLNATASGGAQPSTTFLWSSDPAGFSANIPNPVATPDVNTVYKVKAYNGAEVDSATVTIAVNPLPATPEITQNVNELTSSTGVSYTWYFNGTVAPSFSGQTISPTQNGNYQVQITDANGCKSALSAVINFIYTGSQTLQNRQPVTFFPNPAEGFWNFSMQDMDGYSIRIFDVRGKEVPAMVSNCQLHLVQPVPGVYFLSLVHPDGSTQREKLILQ